MLWKNKIIVIANFHNGHIIIEILVIPTQKQESRTVVHKLFWFADHLQKFGGPRRTEY